MWRTAAPLDDDEIERMCLALYTEDPGPDPANPEHIRRTLRALRDVPRRGRALVLELDGRARGYALVISYWSNELGGEIDIIDELFVEKSCRGQGHGTALIEGLAAGAAPVASNVVALALEVTPDNTAARRLYERLGFRGRNVGLRRRLS
jgi:GNAT superfamily N-acetyltransferase